MLKFKNKQLLKFLTHTCQNRVRWFPELYTQVQDHNFMSVVTHHVDAFQQTQELGSKRILDFWFGKVLEEQLTVSIWPRTQNNRKGRSRATTKTKVLNLLFSPQCTFRLVSYWLYVTIWLRGFEWNSVFLLLDFSKIKFKNI